MRIVLTGATGFVGQALQEYLHDAGHELVALSMRSALESPYLSAVHTWHPQATPAPTVALDGADAVVHLAGESVAGRWTAAKRASIRDSRVLGTRNLVAGMRACQNPPKTVIGASAIGYYGDRGDEVLSEAAAPGDDFLAKIGQEWEAETAAAAEIGARVVSLRIGIVLESGGGALGKMLLPAKLGLGGPLGSGRQWWSWIHREDLSRLIAHSLENEVAGALNAVAPEPMRQGEFSRTLGRVLRRPAFLPAPAFALRWLLGGFATELLSSKRVVPEHTLETGFTFRHPTLEPALRAVLNG